MTTCDRESSYSSLRVSHLSPLTERDLMVVAWVRVLAWLPWLAPDSFLALSSVLQDTHQPLRTEHLPCRPRSVTVQE